MRRRLTRLLAGFVILSVAGGCAARNIRTLVSPQDVGSLEKRSPYLKAHMRDGRVYVLTEWVVDETAQEVRGNGTVLGPNRLDLEGGALTVRISEVALFETNVVQQSRSVSVLGVITGISAALTLYCAINPKACFGSCPTFYVPDGERSLLQAEGFSDSIAPSLEARDVDALYRARPAQREFEVRMRNEALETHVVRYVRVLAAPRPHGGRVIAGQTGDLWQATDLVEARACSGAEGDCLDAVRRLDGRERYSRSDGQDLATRERIELEFDAPGDGPVGLVIGSRQTLLSTFLLYQGLAYMGSTAGEWLARLERGDARVRERARGLHQALGGIEVLVQDARGSWVAAGEVHEAGPLAADVKVVRLPPVVRGRVKVRLRLTRGHWRLDYLALARLGARVDPVRLDPIEVRKADLVVVVPADGLTTLPGDEYRFLYRLPEDPQAAGSISSSGREGPPGARKVS